MPKVTLTFSLPEESDDHKCALHGQDWRSIVFDVAMDLRNDLKYGHKFNTADEALEAVKTRLWDYCRDFGLDPWEG